MSVASLPRPGRMEQAKKMELMKAGLACMGASGLWGTGERGATLEVVFRLSDLEGALGVGPLVEVQSVIGSASAIPTAPLWLPTKAASRGGDAWFMAATKGRRLGACAEDCGSQGSVEDGAPVFTICLSPKTVRETVEQADAWALKAIQGASAWLDSLGIEHETLCLPIGSNHDMSKVLAFFAQVRAIGVSWALRDATSEPEPTGEKTTKRSL